MTTNRGIRAKRLLLPFALMALVPAFSATQAAQNKIADPAFTAVWERTDSLVADGTTKRTWFWGPQPNSAGLTEEYKEGKAGKRLVQYFDKSRMEINNPEGDRNHPFYVTNGLLTVELISGRMQTGNNTFANRQPSRTNVTGDNGDTLAPSYADFAGVSNARGEKRDPDRTGQLITAGLDKGGRVTNKTGVPSGDAVRIAYYEEASGHNIPKVMWDFLNSRGPLKLDGKTTEGRLIEPWFYASGLPISDAYWVRATIAGKPSDVLVQAYERRVLTYVPTNPIGFKVEMGNIGQHYYEWRYANGGTPVAAPTQTSVPVQALSRYAVEINRDLSANTLDRVRDSGARAVRHFVSWALLEPSNVEPSQYNWSVYDSQFKALSDRGLQPIVLIEGCAPWACTRAAGPIRQERLQDFVEFMGAVVERYSKPPYNARYFEMWNEPDSTSSTDGINYNWGTYGARYAAMLKAIRPAVKAAHPEAKIVMGGVAHDNFTEDEGPFYRKFVDDVLDAGGGQAMDVFNFHHYGQTKNWCSYTEKLEYFRTKLRARGLSNMPIMSTETGYTSDTEYGSNDEKQTLYVAQAYAQTAGEGMLSTTWFLAKDAPTGEPGWGVFAKSGLLNENGAPKPAYVAFRASATLIGNRPAVRSLGASDGVTGKMGGYEFGPDNAHPNRLWAVWAWDFSANARCGSLPAVRDFVVPALSASKVKRVLDMLGQPLETEKGSDGSLKIPLDAKPVYIEWER